MLMQNNALNFRGAGLRSTVSQVALTAAMLVVPIMLPGNGTFVSGTALADDECGVGPVVSCGTTSPDYPFPKGIRYSSVVGEFSLTLDAGTTVMPELDQYYGSYYGIYASNYSADGNAPMDINTVGGRVIVDQPSANNVTGIDASLHSATSPLNVTIGDITVAGQYAIGVSAFGKADVFLDTTAGVINSTGTGAKGGVLSYGDKSVTIVTGEINAGSLGVDSLHFGNGATLIDTRAGMITSGGGGIDAFTSGGTLTIRSGDITAKNNAIGVEQSGLGLLDIDTTAGILKTTGASGSGVMGIAFNKAAVAVRSGAIMTLGAAADAIHLYGLMGSLDIDTRAGKIETTGQSASGVFVFGLEDGLAATINTGEITTSGVGAFGVAIASLAPVPAGDAGKMIANNQGAITATGSNSGGVVALSYATNGISGPVGVNANADITAPGQNSVGISASSNSGFVNVSVAAGVQVMGGWSVYPDDLSVNAGWRSPFIGTHLPAAGIVVFSGATSASPAMTITNRGLVGALNDRAITMGYPCAVNAMYEGAPGGSDSYGNPCLNGVLPIQSLLVDNQGTTEGYVTFWDGAVHQFDNSGAFSVRHFADTNGDGIRDTKRVSISDFGAVDDAGAGIFNNLADGIVKMAPVANAPTTDATDYYVPTTGIDGRPLESSFFDLNREGVVQGQFVNLATFNNAGTIDLRGSAVGNTLVMTGSDAAGGDVGNGVFRSDGGTLLLNTVLNAGVVPAGQTGSYSDMLIVDSTALGTGATGIKVTNIGGAGAYTPGNGIELVEVRDKLNSAAGVFTLNGDYTTTSGEQAVIGGAYAYTLFHGGVASDVNDGNWYLRSVLDPVDPVIPVDLIDPVDPISPDTPRYHPGVPVYETYPQHLQNLIRVPTMQQRVGNRYWKDPQPVRTPETVFCKDASQNFRCTLTGDQEKYYANGSDGRAVIENSAIWARIEGSHNHVEPAVTTSGSTYDSNVWKLQAGLDGLLHETEEGSKLLGGINLSYGRASTDVKSLHGYGDMTTDGYGVGGTLTWLDQSGFYVDGQVNLTWFDSDLNSDHVGRLSDGNNGFGYSLSVEAGKKIDLNDVWTITPQAQLVYANVDFDSFTDPFGAKISLDKGDSLQGRLGLSVDRGLSWKDDDGKTRRSHIYGIANLYYEFLDGTRVDVSGTKFDSRPERWTGGLGLGGTYNWNDDQYSVFGEVGVDTSLQNFGDSYSVSGTAGFRVKW